MSSNNASSSKVESPTKVAEPHKEDEHQPGLGVLEEDDEFEEFPVAGTSYPSRLPFYCPPDVVCDLDWDESETDMSHLGGNAPGAAKSGGDKLWEDNWDDDDIEDDFSVQLRYACALVFDDVLLRRGRRNELSKKSSDSMQH